MALMNASLEGAAADAHEHSPHNQVRRKRGSNTCPAHHSQHCWMRCALPQNAAAPHACSLIRCNLHVRLRQLDNSSLFACSVGT